MKIGDKVRLLRGTEEGYIKGIKGNIIEVEIEDGFVIPTLKNEVVLVHHRESEVFNRPPEAQPPKPAVPKAALPQGLHLGIVETSDKRHKLLFVNQTKEMVLFSIYQLEKKLYRRVLAGSCQSDSWVCADSVLYQATGNHYQMRIQMIPCPSETKLPSLPVEFEKDLAITHFRFDNYLDPQFNEVHLISLDQDTKNINMPDTLRIKESMLGGKDLPKQKDAPVRTSEQIVDLHIDPFAENISENQIFSYQLDIFEKAYDRALGGNVEKLKIIHGIGSGKLRAEIHKRLSSRKDVRFFEDSDKDRFGYGATVIYF